MRLKIHAVVSYHRNKTRVEKVFYDRDLADLYARRVPRQTAVLEFKVGELEVKSLSPHGNSYVRLPYK